MGKKSKDSKRNGTDGRKISKGLRSVDDGEDQPVVSGGGKKQRKNSNKNNGYRRSSSTNRGRRGNSSNDDDDAELRNTLQADGLEIVEMSPDGNCLFRALSDQLFGDYGNKHADIRSEVCDFMEKNKDDFQFFLVYEDEDDKEQEDEDARDFEHYIELMREDGTWGGNLEIVAAARLYQ
jgi:OTU domain-containing protein 3